MNKSPEAVAANAQRVVDAYARHASALTALDEPPLATLELPASATMDPNDIVGTANHDSAVGFVDSMEFVANVVVAVGTAVHAAYQRHRFESRVGMTGAGTEAVLDTARDISGSSNH